MAIEIEHKYIVINNEYRSYCTEQQYYMQGYLTTAKECVVRVRIVGQQGYLTIKGENQGATRREYEVEIPVEMAQSMLREMSVTPIIEKSRYICWHDGRRWEIDCFHGENEGLVIAEIELDSEDSDYTLPSFVGKEVTGVERYYNSNLAQRPYSTWSSQEQMYEDSEAERKL